MVTNAATLGRNGVHDFILIRATSLILSAFAIFLLCFVFCSSELTYEVWQGLFAQTWMKVFTIISLFSLVAHAWIGLWQVLTDYVKCARLRMFLQFILNLAAISYFVTGLVVLWGV